VELADGIEPPTC